MSVESEVAGMLIGQTIKYSFEGAEVLLKLTGKGAKELAILLAALLKDEKKWAGATHLKRLSKEGRSIRVIQIPNDRLKDFTLDAKAHGILFAALRERNKKNGVCDIFIKAEDAALVNRVLERTKIACVEIAQIDAQTTVNGIEVNPTTPEAGNLSEPASGVSREASSETPMIEYPPSVSGMLKKLAGRETGIQETVLRPSLSAEELRRAMENPAYLFEDGQRLKSYLEMKSRMHSYSEKNIKLIASQRPDAQMVASRNRWRQMGRTVNDDAEPITINVPGEVIGGRMTFVDGQVFDVSDTHGAPLALPGAPVEGSVELVEIVRALEESIPQSIASIRYDPAAERAVYIPEERAIVLPEGLSDTETFYALAREGYHADMHLHGGDEYRRVDVELMANCNACVIAAHCNMSTDRFDFSDVPEYLQGKDVKEISAILEGAAGHAAFITQKIDFHTRNSGAPSIGMNIHFNDEKVR